MARDPKEDIPRRIYKSTIERIDKHLESAPVEKRRVYKRGDKKLVKADFNAFLVMVLDFYESMLNTPKLYAVNVFDSAEEARGEAIKQSVKTKEPVKWPKVVIEVGEDG
jgi:hypothetical protein